MSCWGRGASFSWGLFNPSWMGLLHGQPLWSAAGPWGLSHQQLHLLHQLRGFTGAWKTVKSSHQLVDRAGVLFLPLHIFAISACDAHSSASAHSSAVPFVPHPAPQERCPHPEDSCGPTMFAAKPPKLPAELVWPGTMHSPRDIAEKAPACMS